MRKRCTRQHFIEYLGYNHLEKQCLLARCTWQRYVHDYGYDSLISTYSESGEPEQGHIQVQVKSTDHIERYKKQGSVYFDLEKRDLETWLDDIFPMLLVLYDAKNDLCYYLELGEYSRQQRDFLKKINKFVRVFIPSEQVLSPDAINILRLKKNNKS